MNKDKYVFAQMVEFLDNNKFRHLVDKYDGNRYVKSFTCWNQLMALTATSYMVGSQPLYI